MGYNSTFMIFNDNLFQIEKDQNIGKKLHDAVLEHGIRESQSAYISPGIEFIETHHADSNAIISVGGNCAQLIGYTHGIDNIQEEIPEILKSIASKYGYRLVKKK